MPNLTTDKIEEFVSMVENKEPEFIQLILKRLGIKIYPQNKDLHRIIVKACTQFNHNPASYLEYLQSCEANAPEFEFLIANITVGETYFFRDNAQMRLLKEHLLPELIQSKRKQQQLYLRIWSAGCASGEEIYTVAMILFELLPDIQEWKLNLMGTDINAEALKKARSGLYYKWSMRSIDKDRLERYFTEQDNQFMLSEKIRDKVHFSYLNLNDNTFPSMLNGTNAQDLIICRNVLIYFNPDCIKRLMRQFSLCLVDGGVLLLGASDPVRIEELNLSYERYENLFFLRHQVKPVPIKNILDTKLKIKKLPFPKNEDTKAPLISAPEVLESEDKISILLEKANKAANQGQLEQALSFCRDSIKLDPTNREAYFVLALTLIELNDLEEAEKALRKTIFLEHQFVEGHFQLGLLLLKRKLFKEGLKSLQNALLIVNKQDPVELVPGSQGLSYERFAEILNKEIALYRRSEGLL